MPDTSSNEKIKQFKAHVPNGYFLDSSDLSSLSDYLKGINVIADGENVLSVEKPGEGNMNFVLRVKTANRSFIVKQSRPWVEKYPQISAPSQRTRIESLFYIMVQEDKVLKTYTPQVVAKDGDSNLFVLEDLGETSDFSDLYNGKRITTAEINSLTTFLIHLHSGFNRASTNYYFTNKDMRKLNHAHIFDLPFNNPDLIDLDAITAGLNSVRNNLLKDYKLVKRAQELGQLYLEDGHTLLHGDYYPGSWLRNEEKIFIIDPEFCFFGPKEFDVGVLSAHLMLSGQPKYLIRQVVETYTKQIELDETLMSCFVGVEIIRRLLGIAQLPLELSIKEKKNLLESARHLVLSTNNSILRL